MRDECWALIALLLLLAAAVAMSEVRRHQLEECRVQLDAFRRDVEAQFNDPRLRTAGETLSGEDE